MPASDGFRQAVWDETEQWHAAGCLVALLWKIGSSVTTGLVSHALQ